MRTFCENAKAVNDAADALRRYEMSGRALLPWDKINTSQRRKWLDKAQVVLDAFKPQPAVNNIDRITAERDGLRKAGVKVVEAMTALDRALGERDCDPLRCPEEGNAMADAVEELEDFIATLAVTDAVEKGGE